MAQEFFDLLYSGYTGEYQLTSALYRNGRVVVGGEGYPADDMAVHYSVAGYLEYARWGL